MELKLYIRQQKRTDKNGKEEYIGGVPPFLKIQKGILPQPRQFPNYSDFIDVTEQVSDLFKLSLTWTLERDDDGQVTPGQSYQRKSSSGTLVFEGDAYQYIKKWLVDDISAPFNIIEVKLVHIGCGEYLDWSINARDITWCEDSSCMFEASLKQKDEAMSCIKSTWIADDWQGWFGAETTQPWSGKKHPRFSYCNEMRPNGLIVVIWWTITQLMSILGPLIISIAPIINSIVWTLKNIIYPIINFILGILGKKKLDKSKLNFIDFKDVKDIFGNFFIESAGCGREHPAPLIRDYISNVCVKCGVKVDQDSFPLFFNSQLRLETSDDRRNSRNINWRENPYYNACFLNGVVERGIRRYDHLNIFKGAVTNLSDWWLPDNAPIMTLDMFLDYLKGIFNAEWRVENNTLYFDRKDHWIQDTPVLDLSKEGSDRDKLLEGICFEWDEVREPSYVEGIYTADAADTSGNEAKKHMNGYASFGDVQVNPKLEGVLTKTEAFGATKFRLDGASTDYVFDAMQQVINTTFITGSVWTTPLFSTINQYFRDFANYALLINQETTTLPKILIWDGRSKNNAKCVCHYDAKEHPTNEPPINYQYNNQSWYKRHHPQTEVLGENLVPGAKPKGVYTVRGTGLVTSQDAMLVNYPMYFEPGYLGTLWDWFHWIDDPNMKPGQHRIFTAKLELCCETLEKLRPFENSAGIVLGQKIKMPMTYYPYGRILEIEINYDPTNEIGKYIKIKGTL